jgi:hypothetical protein
MTMTRVVLYWFVVWIVVYRYECYDFYICSLMDHQWYPFPLLSCWLVAQRTYESIRRRPTSRLPTSATYSLSVFMRPSQRCSHGRHSPPIEYKYMSPISSRNVARIDTLRSIRLDAETPSRWLLLPPTAPTAFSNSRLLIICILCLSVFLISFTG